MTIDIDITNTNLSVKSNVNMKRDYCLDGNEGNIVEQFATVDPNSLSKDNIHLIPSLVGGEWVMSKDTYDVVDPLNGEVIIKASNVQEDELQPFIKNSRSVPKSGLHNPVKNVERYLIYGSIHHQAAAYLHNTKVFDFFAQLIQRVMPKSYVQAAGEIYILRMFFENFSGDRVRMLCRGFTQPGDRDGQHSVGNRWPYGPVSIIAPFNFPLEICVMQLMSALMVGNRATIKVEKRVSLAIEQFLRFLHFCGLPKNDVDFISCLGPVMEKFILKAQPQMTQFTGSSEVAKKLINVTEGKIKIEDAGFNWKILGPDVPSQKMIENIVWTCDQDAYALSGQKCSAQSILFVHKNWNETDLYERLQTLAARRNLDDLTCSPILSHSNQDIKEHIDKLLKLPSSYIMFGGSPLQNSTIPEQYGSFTPTAVFIPLGSIMSSTETINLTTKEIFGPLQVVTEYDDTSIENVIKLIEVIPHYLTAAVVSNNMEFLNKVLGNTVNGTTYAGLRARSTGAPQNHWFGPAGSPLCTGIGTPEAVLNTWTCHREIVYDYGPLEDSWKTPSAT